jgi:hypothetical protein
MMESSLPLPGLGKRSVVRCKGCAIYALAEDHRPRFFDQARGDLELRLRRRAAELDACARLNAAVWECVNAPADDWRWLAYLGHGLDRGDEW